MDGRATIYIYIYIYTLTRASIYSGAHVNIWARTSIYGRATSIIGRAPIYIDAINEINAINAPVYIYIYIYIYRRACIY